VRLGPDEEQGLNVELVNNTFTDNEVGVYSQEVSTARDVTLVLRNNIITGSDVAEEHEDAAGGTSTLTREFNALYGNTTNYLGLSPGLDTISDDCDLSADLPPRLGSGSPCIGAGTATDAPATDYWGTSRGGDIDLGAVAF